MSTRRKRKRASRTRLVVALCMEVASHFAARIIKGPVRNPLPPTVPPVGPRWRVTMDDCDPGCTFSSGTSSRGG